MSELAFLSPPAGTIGVVELRGEVAAFAGEPVSYTHLTLPTNREV